MLSRLLPAQPSPLYTSAAQGGAGSMSHVVRPRRCSRSASSFQGVPSNPNRCSGKGVARPSSRSGPGPTSAPRGGASPTRSRGRRPPPPTRSPRKAIHLLRHQDPRMQLCAPRSAAAAAADPETCSAPPMTWLLGTATLAPSTLPKMKAGLSLVSAPLDALEEEGRGAGMRRPPRKRARPPPEI